MPTSACASVRAVALPEDPAAFVAAAEGGINERDLASTAGVYAPNAVLDVLTDGAFERHVGGDAIRRAWEGYLAAMESRGFSLRKTLLAASGDTITNEWKGTLGGRTDARGMEMWRFDESGRVVEHRMYSLMNVKPATSRLARLRVSASYPITAARFLREQRKRR